MLPARYDDDDDDILLKMADKNLKLSFLLAFSCLLVRCCK